MPLGSQRTDVSAREIRHLEARFSYKYINVMIDFIQ